MLTDQFLAIAERTPPTRYQALERLIECWATPIEFVCLPRLLAGRSLQAFADHLAGGALYRSIVDSAEIRNFERNDLGQDVTLYVSNDTRRPSAGRHLLVGFAASGGRLTLPIAGFLQSICALETDVLLLRDPHRNHFRYGCHGFGGDFLSLAKSVAQIGVDYEQVIALGTSMGGLPAIRYSLMARSGVAISIGGRRWNDVARVAAGCGQVPAFDPICACLDHENPALLYIHAAEHLLDKAEAHAHSRLTGGRVLPVASVATHHVLGELWKAHSLSEFLQQILPVR